MTKNNNIQSRRAKRKPGSPRRGKPREPTQKYRPPENPECLVRRRVEFVDSDLGERLSREVNTLLGKFGIKWAFEDGIISVPVMDVSRFVEFDSSADTLMDPTEKLHDYIESRSQGQPIYTQIDRLIVPLFGTSYILGLGTPYEVRKQLINERNELFGQLGDHRIFTNASPPSVIYCPEPESAGYASRSLEKLGLIGAKISILPVEIVPRY